MTDWLRLWHDMPFDPKWRSIARKTGQPIPRIISVFVLMMVNASANGRERGTLHNWSNEDAAATLDIEEADVAAIMAAMEGKTIVDGRLTGWEKRQPKREDGTAAERKAAWKARQVSAATASEHKRGQMNAAEHAGTQGADAEHIGTHENAAERTGTHRNASERAGTKRHAPETDTETDTDTEVESLSHTYQSDTARASVGLSPESLLDTLAPMVGDHPVAANPDISPIVRYLAANGDIADVKAGIENAIAIAEGRFARWASFLPWIKRCAAERLSEQATGPPARRRSQTLSAIEYVDEQIRLIDTQRANGGTIVEAAH